MKDNNKISVVFVCLLTLLVVWFFGNGLLNHWDNYISGYYHTTLYEICRKYDGDGDFYPMSNPIEGTEIGRAHV